MTSYFTVHPQTPHQRIIQQAVKVVTDGGIIIFPTDSAYALGCTLDNKSGIEHIRRMRQLKESHPLSLICADISQAAQYVMIDNNAFGYLKNLMPGPYTFILPAAKTIPRVIQGVKRKVAGVRVPDCALTIALVKALGKPLLSATAWLPGDELPIESVNEAFPRLTGKIDMVLDAGQLSPVPTTVVDLSGATAQVIRQGAGDWDFFDNE
jgi:tRNA threonylcarbamoyl adenosine modification protein (Sua5/YciO/YrdC/YwlC family)